MLRFVAVKVSHHIIIIIIINVSILIVMFEIEGRQANAKAHKVVDHRTSFPSSREEISQPGIKLPASSLRFGYLSTIIQ